jgi:plastocyanin
MATNMTHVNTARPQSSHPRVLLGALAAAVMVALLPTGPARPAQTQTLTLSLTRFSKLGQLDAGQYMGVSAGRIVLHVGDAVIFVNADTRHHTATGIGELASFPANPRWTDSALQASGKIGPDPWSTGDLAPGAHSAPIVATKPGTFLYGCFYDYSAGMRGEIVVQP